MKIVTHHDLTFPFKSLGIKGYIWTIGIGPRACQTIASNITIEIVNAERAKLGHLLNICIVDCGFPYYKYIVDCG